MERDTTKIIQALAYLADHQPKKTIDYMKAYKLLWLADRYHLRQTGRTITGDAYYAMPFGIVPSDAKCLLEDVRTKMKTPKGYKEKFICNVGKHQFKVISQPDLKVFYDSDNEALDKVLEMYGDYDAKHLSEMSHKFPEWTFYRELLEDEETKNSYRIDFDHFFEDAPLEENQLFDDTPELLALTKDLYHQYNRI